MVIPMAITLTDIMAITAIPIITTIITIIIGAKTGMV